MINNFGKPGHIGNPFLAHVNHPSVHTVSYFEEPHDADCFEIAFHFDHQFVTEIIKGFEQYAEPVAGDTRVYRYVPKNIVIDFINDNS